MRVWKIFAFLVPLMVAANCYKILGLFPLPGKSHMVMFDGLMQALAKKGHEVDVLSSFPPKKPILRYNHLSVEGLLPSFVNNLTVTLIQEAFGNPFKATEFILRTMGLNVCQKILNTSIAHDIVKSGKKYDLIITEIFATDCMLGFAHVLDLPNIAMTSSVNLPWASDRIGLFDNPSSIPTYFSTYSSNMSFWERLLNTISLIIFKYQFYSITAESNVIARNFFGQDLPDLQVLASQRTSLLLVNSHLSVNYARPTVPSFVEVGGLHISEPKTLPEHLERVINVSSQFEGVIYLSMGSMVTTESFPVGTLQGIMDAFKELPKYKVVWKASKERMPKEVIIPSNIEFYDWLPQLDILCNPNVKMFVSHGGLMGSQEAVYCGVPRLGIPLFADQELNIMQSVNRNLSVMVKFEDITKESILKASKALLYDHKYRDSAKLVSQLFKDRPNKPIDEAIFWVEYVIRNKGAYNLRTVGADMPWYQYYLIDVGITLLMFLVSTVFIIYYCLMLVLKTVFSKKHKTE